MNASVSVVCYKSITLSNGEHPLMLRISKDNRKKYLSLGVSILPKYWDIEKNRPTSKCPNKELMRRLFWISKLSISVRYWNLLRNKKNIGYLLWWRVKEKS
ncbi:Arm DNA-binding domain-containing protein [Gabonibacter massiliensis]|uniref:Arm DNA-binding domain-containing protein n=1 Tax=Gabonibacter massiliensis TaxID=1720195 RepID=UPI0011C798F5